MQRIDWKNFGFKWQVQAGPTGKEYDERATCFFATQLLRNFMEDPVPLNEAGAAAIARVEELEKELKKLKTDQKKRKMREKAMATEINVFKRN